MLNKHRLFFESLKNVSQIIVLGHSLSRVDWPYFQTIARKAPAANWQISFFDESEKGSKMELA